MTTNNLSYCKLKATFAYPCSVGSGFDYECLVNQYLERNDFSALQNIMCRLTPPTRDEAQLWAKEQNEQYLFSVIEDLTMMETDFKSIGSHSMMSHFCSESRDARITVLKAYLEDPNSTADTFFILSHAIDQSFVEHFQKANSQHLQKLDGKLEGWKYRVRCNKDIDNGKSELEIFNDAQQGDLVVYDFGFLSPKWLMERIRKRDEKEVKSFVLVVLDSCFSGAWVKYCREKISSVPLIHTTFAIQASCSDSEVSFGNSFIPSFLAFQSMNESSDVAPVELRQHPEYFSSVSESSMISWKLMDAGDFEKVVHKEITSEARVKTLLEAQTVLSNGTTLTKGYQLTTTKDTNPMAMILVEYNSLTYEVHVHYGNGLLNNPTGVSVMDMKAKTTVTRYLYERVVSEKFHCHTDTSCVDSAEILVKGIIPSDAFNDPTKWKMSNYADSTLARITCRSRMTSLKLEHGSC